MDEMFCPACGGDMKHWNQGIYECKDCGNMMDGDFFEDDDDDY